MKEQQIIFPTRITRLKLISIETCRVQVETRDFVGACENTLNQSAVPCCTLLYACCTKLEENSQSAVSDKIRRSS